MVALRYQPVVTASGGEVISSWAVEIERRARQVLDGQSSGEDWDTARDRIAAELRSR